MARNGFGTIVQIDDCLISEEIFTEYFACDYEKCQGCCCVIGDSGAPLKELSYFLTYNAGDRTPCSCG